MFLNENPDSKSSEEQSADPPTENSESSFVDLGEKLFTYRDYTPVPLLVIVLFTAEPSAQTAVLGTLLMVLGEAIRIYSVAFIGPLSRTRNSETTADALVTTGPFAWVRNPLYIGNLFIALGIAAFGGVGWVFVLTALLFAFQYHAIVAYEESLLIKRFGEIYKKYAADVPQWIPAKIPPFEQWPAPEGFSQALKSEKRTLSAILLVIVALVFVSK
jgi:protein-S-isoprenylcysteine O-methyltransferase Ste14